MNMINKLKQNNYRMLFLPLKHYVNRFHFEPDVLKTKSLTYSNIDQYPTMYGSDKYGLSKRILGNNIQYDGNNIPLADFKGEPYYNTVMIAQYGLMFYGFYLSSKSSEDYDRIINAGKWLLDNCCDGALYYNIDYEMLLPHIKINKPFISAMAQGQALSLWVRLYHLTGDTVWLKHCDKAASLIGKTVENGGTATYLGENIWYEEYPSVPGTHVLNGFLFCLIGLYDYYTMSKDAKIKRMLDNGLDSLQKKLPLFDNGCISIYHLGHIEYPCNEVCISPSYHIIHVKLLETISTFFKSDVIEYYIKKWH